MISICAKTGEYMALKFWLGGVRSDRTQRLTEYILNEAEKNSGINYLIVVPEQFVLSTQRAFVTGSANKGILNVDVLSFTRLAHRISDEVGSYDLTVTTLDDMGKNLILQLIANGNSDRLSVFAENVDKLGYIGKIKSIMSEFMQYGISPDTVDSMIDSAAKSGKNMLAGKLRDVNFLYRSFLDYIKDKYTTTEETLAGISKIIYQSDTVKNSVIVFDGFTGFTPVQLQFIGTLLEYALDIHVSLMYEDQNGQQAEGDIKEHELFYLSKRTINQLEKLASDRHVIVTKPYRAEDIYKPAKKRLFVGMNAEEEVKMAAMRVRDLVMKHGYRYKDIAIVTGDIEGYRHAIERILPRYDIPYFIDRTQPLLLNPFVEYIRAIISIYSDNYSYEAMFRFIKSGLAPIETIDAAKLDNYCIATGVKGYTQWHSRFIKRTGRTDENGVLEMEKIRDGLIGRLDDFSRQIMESSDDAEGVMTAGTKATVKVFATALYHMIVHDDIENKLRAMSDKFLNDGNLEASEEYRQIYIRVMNILDELVELIPNEKIDIRSFGNLIDAGLDSIRVGIAPKGADYIQVGDLTRSRINSVKALFIIGANEGVIPKAAPSGGIISENEREFLLSENEKIVMAPTAREDAYSQRLYLYMAMDKPIDVLYISYAKMTMNGKTQMPSYIIRQVRRENPDVILEEMPEMSAEELYCTEDIFECLSVLLRKLLYDSITEPEYAYAKKLLKYLMSQEEHKDRVNRLISDVILRNALSDNDSIGSAIAEAIYGKKLIGSVTRLEVYANCAYQYFLKYALKLCDREIFSFEAKDMGTIFHDSLSEYSQLINKSGANWADISDEKIEEYMDKAVETTVAKQQMGALYSNARTEYMVERIKKIMRRTASVISYQVREGEFTPKYFEVGFEQLDSFDSLNIRLSDDQYMKLLGRIDRVDTCEKDDVTYVKIIDYKSSSKKMDFAAIYEGRQLQLLVYLNAAIENEVALKSGNNVVPAGVLYYHIDNPVIEEQGESDDETIRSQIVNQLKLKGLINSDENGMAIELIDRKIAAGEASDVVNAKHKKDGGFCKSTDIISGSEFDILSRFVSKKISMIGKGILSGDISVPVADGRTRLTNPDCTYCEYKPLCNGGYCSTETEDTDEEDDDAVRSDFTSDTGKKMNREQIIDSMKQILEGEQ